MPYVKAEDRVDLDDALYSVIAHIDSPGKANYAITQLLLNAFEYTHYSDYNTTIGILECAKLEFYRRAVASFEDAKLEANGDVY